MESSMTTVATAQASSSEWSECYHEQPCNGNRNIWDEMADFEESYYNLTENPNEELLYRLLRFVDDHMPLRIGSDLCLRHVRDESVRCLASSYMRDANQLSLLLQKVKEIDPSLETRSDEYIASTPLKILFRTPDETNASELECASDPESYTEVD
jgi:hypothetical protein